jgi:hypothetical protein
MFHPTKKSKPTLNTLLESQQVVTGKNLLQHNKEKEAENLRQKALLNDAIEFERQNRRNKGSKEL